MMDVSLLGTGGMMPLPNRYLTSLLLRLNGSMLMIDCGEGTQVTMKQQGWGFKNLDCLCLTHYHADHVSGLPGLLLTLGNSGRTEPLTIIGPPDLSRVVEGLMVITPELPFDIELMELPFKPHKEITVKNTGYIINVLPAEHGRPCFAYTIEARRMGKFNLEKAEGLNLPKKYWSVLQKGEAVEYAGSLYTPGMVMGSERKGIKIAYCTDSRPAKSLPEFIRKADLFICEGLYGDDEKAALARSHNHMIYSEAATLAKAGQVSEMWLTHYSPALINPKEFLAGAKNIFQNTCVGFDRKSATIKFEDNCDE